MIYGGRSIPLNSRSMVSISWSVTEPSIANPATWFSFHVKDAFMIATTPVSSGSAINPSSGWSWLAAWFWSGMKAASAASMRQATFGDTGN